MVELGAPSVETHAARAHGGPSALLACRPGRAAQGEFDAAWRTAKGLLARGMRRRTPPAYRRVRLYSTIMLMASAAATAAHA